MPSFIRSARGAGAALRALDVRADDGDARDYIFTPSLQLLPEAADHGRFAPILDQGTEGACVGFALATVINISLRRRGTTKATSKGRLRAADGASPRMLYEMGKRHDEWGGDSYEGTSPRGGMKAWHKHGVTTERLWPFRRGLKSPDRELTPERSADALSRPIGAYFRIVDSDVGHLQAAIVEGDAVLASAWIHDGWQDDRLLRPRRTLPTIRRVGRAVGLHAFAIVGYTEAGLIVQNSWGTAWGRRGFALLGYDEWFDNRQDAWVARPAPTTLDSKGTPKVFVVGFSGGAAPSRSATAASGLEVDSQVLPYLVNTGDRGGLSAGGSLSTHLEELPSMARHALTAPVLEDGCRHIVLYAHGGLNGEGSAVRNAARLWHSAHARDLRAYFFVWESGIAESVIGWLKSADDASGPSRFNWGDAWEAIKKGTSKVIRRSQKVLGRSLAPVARNLLWDEMKGRASGAARSKGGAALFAHALLAEMATTPNERYKLHVVAHSAGAIYLGWLYERVLSASLVGGNASLGSIHLLAPAISVARAHVAFGATPLPPSRVRVHMLKPHDEEHDSIQIYPSSLLTYAADHLERKGCRVPLLGIRRDFNRANLDWATPIEATVSRRHGEFDDAEHEIEEVFDAIRP